MEICEKNKCTGCFACFNICPKNAINMIEDEYGAIYPKIDKEKCVECGMCQKICPSINKPEFINPKICYAMHSKNENIREKSTSGGIATELSKYIIKSNGIVYGASFIEGCNVNHIRVTDEKDLEKLQGSKYVHCYINDTFKNVKNDLQNNKRVLFIGTPCQIAGLKAFLGKEYENLILIDIICHGVPTQKYLKDEVLRLNGDLNIDRVNFRNGNNYGLYVVKENDIKVFSISEGSPYIDAFLQTLILRENCYNCMYANSQRVSDITIGDFWGLSQNSRLYKEHNKGVSTVIISTDKGYNFIEECKDIFEFEEREYQESVNGNTQLRIPAPRNPKVDLFKKRYLKLGFYKSYKKCTIIIRLKRKIKKIIKKS